MSNRPTVDRVEAFPLTYSLRDGGYGASRIRSRERAVTLVKITDSDGGVGWGEASGPPAVVRAWLGILAPDIMGRPAGLAEHVWLEGLARRYHMGTSGPQIGAISGIDMALWDLVARSFGVSVSELLGGRARETVRAYASTGYYTASAGLGSLRDYISAASGEGFDIVKIKIGSGVDDDVARVRTTLEILGEGGTVIVDYNANTTLGTVSQSLTALAEFHPYWAEEPLPPTADDDWLRVQRTGIPLAAGEALQTRFEFHRYITEGRVDIVQPNLSVCGGFTEAKAISAMAVARGLRGTPRMGHRGAPRCVAAADCVPPSRPVR